MNKYWLVFALLGAVGCSGAAAEEGGSNQEAVSHKDDSGKGAVPVDDKGAVPVDDKGAAPVDVDVKPGTEAPIPDKGDPAPVADCHADLDKLAKLTEEVTDPAQLALLKEKYEALRISCEAPAPSCDAELAQLADLTAQTTDPAQIAALKEKYLALQSSCSPNAGEPGEPGDKNPPTKDGAPDAEKPPTKDGTPDAEKPPTKDEPSKLVK